MWLLRGLSFTHQALHAAQSDPNVELAKAFTKGYDASLKQYHNFVVRGVFSVCTLSSFWFACYPSDPTAYREALILASLASWR